MLNFISSFFKLNEQEGTFKLLFIMNSFDNPPFHQQILNKGMNARTVKKARKILKDFQLIEYITDEDDPTRKLYYYLTEKGKELIRMILEINAFLESSP